MRRRNGRSALTGSTLLPLPSLLSERPPEIRLANRTAMRHDWVDPTDDKPSAARTAQTVYGHASYCPLRWCQRRHGARSRYSPEHIMAADRLRVAFDGARIGFSALKDWRPVTSINYRPATGPTTVAMLQLRSQQAFDAAWAVLDEDEQAMVLLVVLKNVATGRAAEHLGVSKPWFTDHLTGALDRLCAHYEIRSERTAA
jgi:hypothetical protein